MKIRFGIVMTCVLLCGICTAEEKKPAYKVGETWTYDVEGVEYNIFGQEKQEGVEIVKIAGIREVDGVDRLVINIKNGRNIQKLFADEQGNVYSIDFEGRSRALSMDVIPPMPDHSTYTLKPGETQDYQCDLIPKASSWIKINMKMDCHLERLEDETVTVPAGTYENCKHYVTKGTMTIGNPPKSLTIQVVEDIWTHPSVNGLVKTHIKYSPIETEMETIKEESEKTKLLRRYFAGRRRPAFLR